MTRMQVNQGGLVVGAIYGVIGSFPATINLTTWGTWAVVFKPVEWTLSLVTTMMPVAYVKFVPFVNIAIWALIGMLIANKLKR